ncbi:bifunctional tRNA (5-methylaminomethyl-2-thiouridine)(34)-methyltransferase MnmD/FAD-dependent 5-carboxymethylaminomethyl-2-thiouridine(34) oxidoreductase MnmC [Carnimonas nigrificans]|uniref:bifunctional tRNA (5-methylaminomethyl-2-thiouridine)(34)-methyltransferase MnmD/FAD-dependent 5-carboxymethylaminomethyl-2-thiouridine(34) oxidoreductase MnmC n=1 Tax=Carnimonas nigrificans TaxID=64323 RepID=UPI00046EA415|nr:bifunctional tRNA (5-methylaminomethyl-2-thiouridine)(34)-methyltransferase MnmD/FAD-dependent 5-carboxymethylaminomethyl-2-thiouridine(34) oxidoreductase MnmC [Carnimonas nigrificans]
MPHTTPSLAPLSALTTAKLEWNGDEPQAVDFDDVYFSREDGRRETEHVFIQHNHLPQRFAQWHEQRPFIIAETGFGSGLNALCAWQAFAQHAPPQARLHMVSVERYPMTQTQLERALRGWPEFSALAQVLVEQWPQPVAGVHRLTLTPRFTLDLYFGEASERLGQLDGEVDAWFLDGFAPAKNPDMWQSSLFDAMARVSHAGTTFATFTAAGVVKRGLAAAGFHWEKVAGFGHKRDMLRGYLATPAADQRRAATPWFAGPRGAPRQSDHIAVVGAGIAGCATAAALAARGHRVTLLDPAGIAQGASGNDQAALYIKLAVASNLQSRFYLAALLYLRRLLTCIAPAASWWEGCGTLDVALDQRQADRQQRFLANHALPDTIVRGVTAAEASTLAGSDLSYSHGALFYPMGGWLAPRDFCQRLIEHPNIEHQALGVDALQRGATGWQLNLSDGTRMTVDQVVVCAAWASQQLAPFEQLPLMPIRGQVSCVDISAASITPLSCTVCANGYAPPPYRGQQLFGATFTPHSLDTAPSQADADYNLAELTTALPQLAAELTAEALDSHQHARVGIRTATPDKSPFAGAMPDIKQWQSLYAELQKDAKRINPDPGPRLAGLWVNVGHGSRGMVSAPLCAELIAAQISGEPAPMELALVDHLDPGRRIIRELITTERRRARGTEEK